MKAKNFLLFACVLFSSCGTQPKEKPGIVEVSKQVACEPYFDFDAVEYYSVVIGEDSLWAMYEKENKSKNEKKLKELLLDYPATGTISDTSMLNGIEEAGFKKKNILPEKFADLNKIFCERRHEIAQYAACKPIYRDILIFKKTNHTVGLARVCFKCNLSEIIGTIRNTEEFGQSGDYDRLEKLLH